MANVQPTSIGPLLLDKLTGGVLALALVQLSAVAAFPAGAVESDRTETAAVQSRSF